MDYEWFLMNGWPYNDQDRRIIKRWKDSGRSIEDLTTGRLNHFRWRLLFELDRWKNVDGATAELFPDDPDPEPPSATPPNPSHRFVDRGVVLHAGLQGSLDTRLHGMLSPCRVWQHNGTLRMLYIGASGNRSDGGPAYRRLLEASSSDGGATWFSTGVVKRWRPTDNADEEGVLSATEHYFSALTATGPTTVSSDVRRLSDNSLVLDHTDSNVWGYGDELFVHSELPDGGLLYIAKNGSVRWGLGQLRPDGSTRALINPRSPEEYVVGGGAVGHYFVLVQGFDEGGSVIEWYDSRKLPGMAPIHSLRFGARHVTPYWDGKTWWLYGRYPKGNEIRRWELVA